MTKKQFDGEMCMCVLQQIPAPVMAIDTDYNVIFLNKKGLDMIGKSWEEAKGCKCYDLFNSRHCNTDECLMKKVMAEGVTYTERNDARINDKTVPIEYTAAPLNDKDGNIVGGVEFILDISERVEKERRLKEQSRTIAEISTPAIRLWDRVVILPVVGVVDSLRAQQMMDTMLTKIAETSSKVIILDIQGVAAVDTAVANHLIKIAKATRLMGCRCILSGISPAVAQSLVELGINLGDVTTNSTLKDALSDAFDILNLQVTEKS